MASQGIQLPVSLQLSNLQDIVKQLKQFSQNNVLSDSLGGKKLEKELNQILDKLEKIGAKSKTAFTSQADFSSIQKEIDAVEVSLNKAYGTFQNLSFSDLKIPSDVLGNITELQERIRSLNNSLITFKGTQKEKLINNQDFLADLKMADPKKASKIMSQTYDEMYQSIHNGMTTVNNELATQVAEYKRQQAILTQSEAQGTKAMTQWGAIDFIQAAFKKIPSDQSKMSSQQQIMSQFMNIADNGEGFTTFKGGSNSYNAFLSHLRDQFQFSPEQIEEIKSRVKAQVEELKASVNKSASASTVIRQMGSDQSLAAKILFGDGNQIQTQIKEFQDQQKLVAKLSQDVQSTTGRQQAYERLYKAFDLPNQEIKAKAAEIAQALQVPEAALKQFEASIVAAATKSPQIAALFQNASRQIGGLTQVVDQGKQKLAQIDKSISKMQGISNFINRYIGIYAIMRRVTTMIRNAFNNIKELDKTITNIAVVTNMSQEDLWGKIGQYTQMAQQYGVATKDVYTVSQIFYQQGLQTAQVMSLTTETLKMAKIAGMDYSSAANAMTVAIRAFNIEMSDAQQVTDTYSALAAKFAVSSAEIANAMEKTASSAANVGMSLQSTSAFMSVMIQTTRESAQNIGSALKSIISRYGEMKASPSKLLNVDGEDVAFNKVDTALKSIGISIKDSAGQFRDFDDVIMELAKKWNTLDNNTQRYIATVMAGNRQQSRFIALVSNYDELSRAMDVANNSQNASIVQTAKTMDSLETKAQQLQNAFSQIYLDLHIENGLKSIYDWLTRVLKTVGKLGVLNGALPTLANLIGVGTGAKSLIGMWQEHKQEQKFKVNADVEQAQKDIEKIRNTASQDIKTRWLFETNLSQVQSDIATTQVQAEGAKANAANFTFGNSTDFLKYLSQNTSAGTASDISQNIVSNQPMFVDKEGRQQFITDQLGVKQTDPMFTAIDSFIEKLTATANGFDLLTTAAQELSDAERLQSDAKQAETNATYELIPAKTTETNASLLVKMSKDSEGQASYEIVDAEGQKVGETYKSIESLTEFINKTFGAGTSLQKLEQSAHGAASSLDGKSSDGGNPNPNPNPQQPLTNPQKTDTTNTRSLKDRLFSWGDHQTAMKVTSLVSGLSRIVGTAITATGASIQDKSTDNIERSKFWTGVGNGISMAGTGASMGMAFGPVGAIAGGIIGLIGGSIGALIDALDYNLAERIANAKEEAKKANDESLKAQAATTDMSGQIDNLKQLQKTMYNSAEDMQAYKEALANMADTYPELVTSYDSAGNAIINITQAEDALAQSRLEGAVAARNAAAENVRVAKLQLQAWDEFNVNSKSDKGTVQTESKTSQLRRYIGIAQNVQGSTSNEKQNSLYDTYNWAQDKGYQDTVFGNIEQYSILGDGNFASLLYNMYNDQFKDISTSMTNEMFKQFGIIDWFDEYKDQLGLQDINTVANRSSDSDIWTFEQILSVLEYMDAIEAQYNNRVESLSDLVDSSVGYEQYIKFMNGDQSKDADERKQLADSATFQSLYTSILTNKMPTDQEYTSLDDWAQDTKNTQNPFYEAAEDAYQKFSTWYEGLAPSLRKEFLDLDYTQFKSADEIIRHFNIAEGSDLAASITQNFIEQNQANRDRILGMIYRTDSEGNIDSSGFNTQLEGIGKLSGGKTAAQLIAWRFDDSGIMQIATQYANFFASQISDIDQLAQDGYTDLASKRLSILSDFSLQLGRMSDSAQQDLFGILSTVDLSNYDSIQTAIKNVQSYGKTNNVDVGGIVETLAQAAGSLAFNVATLGEDLINKITGASKEIDGILTTNKSGLSLDKAIQEFNTINATLSDPKTFDALFTYDAALGKYVYTVEGLNAAMAAREGELADRAEKMRATANELTDNKIVTTEEGPNGKIYKFNEQFAGGVAGRGAGSSFQFQSSDQLIDDIIQTTGVSEGKAREIYRSLAQGFIANTKAEERTWDNFIAYVEKQAQFNSEQADNAEAFLNAFSGNKKNQLYGAIDWNALATGTDLSETNQALVEELALQLDTYSEEVTDETGKVIGRKFLEGVDVDALSWEEVQDAYLDQLYEGNDAMKAAAKAAIKGQQQKAKSSQVSTAITEVLNGVGQVLSQTTISLLGLNMSQLDSESDGVIDAGQQYLQTAIELYDTHKNNLLSIAERNKAYSEILTQKYSQNNTVITSLGSGASLDIAGLTSLFDSVNLELSNFFDAATGTWMQGFENFLSTDQFGKTRITDWGQFTQMLSSSGVDMAALSGTFEFQNAYSSYVDGLVTLDNQAQNLIKTSYDNAFSSITDFKSFNVSQLSDEIITRLQQGGAADINNGVLTIKNAVQYAENARGVFAAMSTLPAAELQRLTGLTKADLAKDWKNAEEVLTQVGDTWIGLSENITGLTTDNISTLIEKGDFSLPELNNFTRIGDSYVMILDQYEEILRNKLANDPNAEAKINEAVHKAEQAVVSKISGLDWTKMLNGTATSAEIDTFMTALDASLTSLRLDVEDYYTDGQLDVSGIITDLKALNSDIANQIVENLTNMIQEARNTVLSAIGTAGQYAMEGTTNLADMQKFIDEYNRIKPKDAAAIDMSSFSYDTNLQKFTLDGSVLQNYVEAQKEQLRQLGLNDAAIDAYISDQTSRMLQSNMDVTSILDGMSTPEQQRSMQNFAGVVDNYLAQGNKVLRTITESESAVLQNITAHGDSEVLKDYIKYLEEARTLGTEQIIEILYSGGEEAVNVLKQLKGKEVTSEELSAVYNAGMNRLTAAQEALESGAGTILTGLAAEIATTAKGITTQSLPDGSVVITEVTNMVDVYANLYARMSKTAGATTSSLNAAYAKLLTAADQKNIDALETLQNASGMAYDAFGELLASYGVKLEDVVKGVNAAGDQVDWGVGLDGFGKIRITDFNAFATQMGWDISSPEYAEAYSQWADSMAELQNAPINMMNSAAEELKGLTEAKAGSVVNVSYLERLLPESFGNIVQLYGAELNNGLLKITETTNLPQLITAIANEAARTGNMLPEQLAEVADAVASMLDNIINAIKSGITGSLKNTEANSLQQWVDQFGIKLDFTQTAEGLKLSQESAIQLYNNLKKVDGIKAKLVFDELNKSLMETNENYQSVSDVAARIAWIEDQKHPERRDQYKEELELAKEIYAVRSTTEDSSFNFMQGKIPGAQNNPINYFNNWAQALQILQNAKKSYSKDSKGNIHKGLIDYQDWYNIVNEMNNLAALGDDIEVAGVKLDGSLEAAAKLIEKGASALTVDSAGNVKVALGDIGVDFKAGAGDMSKGIDAGIKEMAQSQVQMLDGLIALLEVIVSMEQLGDIDTDSNGIDLSDLFVVTYDKEGNKKIDYTQFNQIYEDWRNDMIEKFNDYIQKGGANGTSQYIDLGNALSGIKIGGLSLIDIIKMDPNQLLNEADESLRKVYPAVLNAFTQAAQSGNYDLDNIQQSIIQVLRESGLTETVQLDIGTTTWSISGNSIVSIDWSTPSADEVLTKFKEQHPEYTDDQAKQEILQKVKDFQEGKGKPEDVITVLQLHNKITLSADDDGGGTVVINGHNYTFTKDNQTGYINAAAAEELGLELPKNWQYQAEQGGNLIIPTKIGNVEIEVEIVDGKPIYHGEHGDYNSQQELLDGEYDYYRLDRIESGDKSPYLTKDKWIYKTFGIRAAITPKITFENGGPEVDLNNDPGARKTIKEITQKTDDFFLKEENLKPTGDGNYLLNYGGLDIELDGDTVVTGDKIDPEKVKSQLMAMLGLDVGLAETISTAVTDAMSSVIENLKNINNEDLQATATALSDILTSLTSLGSINYEDIAKGIATIKPPTSEEGTTSEEGVVVPVDKATIVPASVEVSLEGIKPALAENQVVNLEQIPVTATTSALAVSLDANSQLSLDSNDKGTEDSPINLGSIGETKGIADSIKVTVDDTLTNKSLAENSVITVEDELSALGNAKNLEVAIDSGTTIHASYSATGDNDESTPLDIGEIANASASIKDLSIDEADNIEVASDLGTSIGKKVVDSIQEYLDNNPLKVKIENPTGGEGEPNSPPPLPSGVNTPNTTTGLDISPINDIQTALDSITTDKITAIKTAQDDIKTDKIDKAKGALNAISSAGAVNAKDAINGISSSNAYAVRNILNNLQVSIDEKTAKANLNVYVRAYASAKGNVALAGGTPTLMGELGPELVVSNGRYFVVGQAGAEFVDLDKDAIVFNHRQTQQLLTNGGINSRGKPFTNETNAISRAKGNVEGDALGAGLKVVSWNAKWAATGTQWSNDLDMGEIKVGQSAAVKGTGEAMASASAALAALKQLRAQWEALAGLSVKDLAGKGGGGGGGGGGGDKAFIKQLELWYNWLQRIAQLETQITHQESVRNKIASDNIKNGSAYYRSQKKSLEDLKEESKITKDLMVSQQKYFSDRIQQLNSDSAFNKLYKFNDNGQLEYNSKKTNYKILNKNGTYSTKQLTGFEFLSELNKRDPVTGQAKYTAKQQYEMLKKAGFAKFMEYDSSGNKIDQKQEGWEATALQAFWDKIDADKEEMQSLHDSINEYSNKVLELQQKQNELLQEMQDNQMEVENAVLDAMVESREREIDELSDLKDAYSDAANRMVEGLNKALTKEREGYTRNQEENDLLSLRRRLAIAQRSGAPASEIASLQEEIRQKSQESYFNKQEQQIQDIQDAADAQIQRMDKQINILTETLEYQKKYGLLWDEVYEIMSQTPEQIRNYINENTEEFLGKSALARSEDADDWFFKASQWTEFRKDLAEGKYDNLANSGNASPEEKSTFQAAMATGYGSSWNNLTNKQKEAATEKFAKYYKETGDFSEAAQMVANDYKWAMKRAGNWAEKAKEYEAQYGTQAWSTAAAKFKELYVTKGEKGIEENLDNLPIWTTRTNSKGGINVVQVTAKTDTKWVWDKKTAYAQKAWQELLKANPTLTSTLTPLKKGYIDAYVKSQAQKYNISAGKTAGNDYLKKQGIKNLKAYDVGGMVDSTGMALLHAREAVLTSKQADVLRNDILGKDKNSLVNLLQDFRKAYAGIGSAALNVVPNVIIENASVNMNIDHIANDYDARRAGEQALTEMMRIARKNGTANSISRR